MIELVGSLWSVPTEDELPAAHRLAALGLRRLHWDSSDGRFANPGGFSAARAREIADETGLAAEAHLMHEKPVSAVDEWTEICDVIFVHVESEEWQSAVERIVRRGATPGLAISPATPVSLIPDEIDVLCMSIVPGTAGSAFDHGVLPRIAALREAASSRRIAVDGGITSSHAELLRAAGADRMVVGTDLFGAGGTERWSAYL